MGRFGVGQALPRVEDPRLLTGKGCYSADWDLPGQAHLYILRSPRAHAEIRSIDCGKAATAPGVLAVLTDEDLTAEGIGDIPCLAPVPGRNGGKTIQPPFPVLARGRVRYVGDAVAAVVAESRDQARDAAELIQVDYEDLPFVVATGAALASDAPQIWPQAPGNLCVDWELGNRAACDAAFDAAAHVTRLDLVNNRVVVNPLEPRACLGDYDPESERFTLYTGSQGSHRLRNQIAQHIFKLPADRIRVVTGDVGGGFGMKIFLYADQVLALFAARRLGRPVKWVAERSEDFLSDSQGRDQVTRAALALDEGGKMLAIRVDSVANLGAYLSNFAPLIPTEASGKMFAGLYGLEAAYCNVKCVFTNSVPVDAYRGAGRPEAAYVVERLVDRAARELGVEPAELRRRNLIQRAALPYTSAMGVVYDSGDFPAILEQALEAADCGGLVGRKAASRAAGRLRGLGHACYVEACGAVGEEEARLSLDPDGGVTLVIGTQTNGQGHETAYQQLLNERFGLPPELIRVRQGDSDLLDHGGGTGGSRSLLMGGLAIEGAAVELSERLRRVASHLLEAAEVDLEPAEAGFVVVGTDHKITFAEIARAAEAGGLPAELEEPLTGAHHATAPAMTYPNGCHVCELEIDPETGRFEILRYVIVDDFGTVINPLLVAGQVHGGTAQGIGQAALEHTAFDAASGQLLSGSFMDYCLPRADDLPAIELTLNQDLPCTTNPMGIKGAGEAGAIGSPPATVNAILDALAPLGVTEIDMPVTPERLWRSIRAAQNLDLEAA